MASFKAFIDNPGAALLNRLTKDQIAKLATHYNITLTYDYYIYFFSHNVLFFLNDL